MPHRHPEAILVKLGRSLSRSADGVVFSAAKTVDCYQRRKLSKPINWWAFTMTKIKIDFSKLLGYRVAAAAGTKIDASTGAAIGGKGAAVGTKGSAYGVKAK